MPDSTMKRHVTILITGAGTTTAVSVIKGIQQQKEFSIRLVTCDRNDNVSGRYMSDRFYTIPSAEDAAFLPSILRIVKKEHVNIIIPIIDYEFKKFANNVPEFTRLGATVVLSGPEVIDICTDKFKTMKLFETTGLPHAKSYSVPDIRKKHLHYPLFLKPSVFGRSTIDAYKINNKKDLMYYSRLVDRPIIQEYINGTEVTIDALNDLSGKFIAAVARIRTETKSGLSIKGVVIHDDHLIHLVKRLTESLPIIGPSNIQCFKNGSRYIFSEINPRFSGAHALTIQAGLNSIYLLCKLYFKERITAKDVRITSGVRMIRYWEELFITPDKKTYQPGYSLVKK
jgi:carbamoyl-phosphate synthase large subunit